MLRRMIDACGGALMKCFDSDADPMKLVEEIETDIFKIRTAGTTESIRDLKELVMEEFQTLMKLRNHEIEIGISTGYKTLDDLTGGLKKGEMFVLAARPSIGKTSLGLNVITNVAIRGEKTYPVAFFSLEMTDSQIARRLLCTLSGVPENVFWSGMFHDSDLPKLTTAAGMIGKAPLYIDPTGGLTISELRAKARRLKNEHDIKLIVIDYLQLMKAGGTEESRQVTVANISGGLKAIAKELNIPVLVLAQLNRETEKGASGKQEKQDALPKLSNLRESGAIEQDADVVCFIHRNRDDSKEGSGKDAVTYLIVEKNRNGKTGTVKVQFVKELMEFRCIEHKYGDGDVPKQMK